jgi:hypothetical protein
MSWLTESNRLKYFLYAIPCGLLGIMFVAGLAIGMEFKDKMSGGKFDFLDILATLLGGMIGFVLMLIIVIATGAIDWYINILIKLSELL